MKRSILVLIVMSTLYAGEAPEGPSGYYPKELVVTQNCMVVSANPLASKVGYETLLKGGSAIDAALAMQCVLNVVEPQSSGIGGGAFLLFYDNLTGQVKAYDGREIAPWKVNDAWFLGVDHQPIPLSQAVIGGRSVGVPGVLKMLEAVHQEYGNLPWNELFTPAIHLAENGFKVSERLHRLSQQAHFPEKITQVEGEILKNPELAATFRIIAERGSDPFYHGVIAKAIVEAVQKNGGVLNLHDLAEYRVIVRDPIISSYDEYLIYGFPPPSSGGIAIAQILSLLSHFDLKSYSLGSPLFIDLFSRASRRAFADRDYYVADPQFFPVPTNRLLNTTYLAMRAKGIHRQEKESAGHFPGASLSCCPPMIFSSELELPSTTHLCVIDPFGNCLSMTSSIENAFGSTVKAAGFFLNNQMTDFSLIPEKEGKRAANRIEPGKRPMSSMSPTLVFKTVNGKKCLHLALGSAGGSRIIDYVAKALCGVLIFNLNIQEAIAFPNFASIDNSIELESNTSLTTLAPELQAFGNTIKTIPLTSGSQGIQVLNGKLIGGADPRREGCAIGQ